MSLEIKPLRRLLVAGVLLSLASWGLAGAILARCARPETFAQVGADAG